MLPLMIEQLCYHLTEKKHDKILVHVPAGSKVSLREKNVIFLDIFFYQALNIKSLIGKMRPLFMIFPRKVL